MKEEQQERTSEVHSNAIDGVASARAKGEQNEVIALKAFSIGARFHIEFGAALIAANKYAEAACEFEQAAASAPDHAIALGNLGDTLVALGRVDDGSVRLKRAAMLDASCAATAFNLTAALAAASCHAAAVDHFHGALAMAPDLARAWSSLGASLYALNRLDESEAAFRHALKLDANRAEAWHGLGVSLHALGKPDEAREALARAVMLEPGIIVYHRSLAEAKHHAAADRALAAPR